MDLVLKAQVEKIPMLIVSLDAEKAFDYIEWQYLFSVAEKFQMGAFFQAWLQTLYRHQSAVIDLEQNRSGKIMLHRGVKQGCLLSALLFALALEPLASMIHHDKEVKGIQVGKEEAKFVLYTDDNVCFLEQPLALMIKLSSIIEQFGILSGYKIHKHKSIFLGSNISETPQQRISKGMVSNIYVLIFVNCTSKWG